jgi:site-specific recombinase XerD
MAAADSSANRSLPRVNTTAGRKALPPRRDPYFVPIDGIPHASLGYRKIGEAGTDHGTWVARVRAERADGSLGYTFEALGAHPDHHAAAKAARAWLELRSKGVTDTDVLIRKVCSDFADTVETSRVNKGAARPKHAHVLRQQFKNWVDNDPIGAVKLSKLTKAHVLDWRQRLESTPDATGKQRTGMSINKEMSGLRSALNWAMKDREMIADDRAWRLPLRPIPNAAKARTLYLTSAERKLLLDAVQRDLQPLVKAMLLVPARPSALAALTVADYERRLALVTFPKDKTANATGRQLQLPPLAGKLFEAHCKDKLPGALIFPNASGEQWTAHQWKKPIRLAAKAAFPMKSPARKTTMYVLRHSVITDLLRSGVPVALVAQWAGTSIVEIQKHYAKIIPSDARNGLAVLEAGFAA